MVSTVSASRTLTFSELAKTRRGNKHDRWSQPADDPNTAASRLLSGEMVPIGTHPKWQIPRDATVFTIGSCFARNAEYHLADLGMNIPTFAFRAPAEYFVSEGSDDTNAVLNKYNTSSIESEVLQAFGMADYPDHGFIEADGLWWDPLTTHMRPLERHQVEELRHRIGTLTRDTILAADAVLLTLGLNQIWQDAETGVYLNQMPPPQVIRALPKDRWLITVAGYEDNLRSLTRTVDAIHEVNPGCKIVATVSPVPMGATMTAGDIIQENTLSKATLRTVAQAVADRYDHVDYFPSFEMVTLSPPELTWEPDRLHVRSDAVKFVIQRFIDGYVTD